MAGELKSFFNREIVAGVAADIGAVHPSFAQKRFIAECLDGLDGLELLDRARHIAAALKRHLPGDFERASAVLIGSLKEELADEPRGMYVFRYLPHVLYVSEHGLEHFEAAMRAQYELTKRFSAEFSIRSFLVRHPDQALARLREWTRDPNPHVRRLVSEGTRPRLPWAMRLRAFQKDPAPVIALLELLKDDPELYVRRSVANNLNDIAKDHPKIAVEVCKRWSVGASADRKWIIRHALRTLVKKGDPGALALLGFAGAPQVRVSNARFTPKQTRIGGAVAFSFDLASTAKKRQTLLIDFAVHFVKANGKTSRKVFKLTKLDLAAGAAAHLDSRVSFAQMTTRKHYPGVHTVELLVNGRVFPLGQVKLLAGG